MWEKVNMVNMYHYISNIIRKWKVRIVFITSWYFTAEEEQVANIIKTWMINDCIISSGATMQRRSWETGHSCMFTFCKTYAQSSLSSSSSMYVYSLICSTNMAFKPKLAGDANYVKTRLPNWATNSWGAMSIFVWMLNHDFLNVWMSVLWMPLKP